MINALLSLIPGGLGTTLIASISAVLLVIWRVFATGKKSGRNEARAKEADAYEKHLKELSDAHDARNAVGPDDSMPDDDPYRRD